MCTVSATTPSRLALLFALFLSADDGHAQDAGSFSWVATSPREPIPAAFASAPLVLIMENTHFVSRLERGAQGFSARSTAEVHGIVRVMDEKGMAVLTTNGIRIQGMLAPEVFRARIVRADGTVQEVAEDGFHLVGSRSSEEDPPRLVFDRHDLVVGDDVEFILRSVATTPLRFDALYLHGELPIVHKELIIDMETGMVPWIRSFNGYPEHEADPVGAADRRRSGSRVPPEMERLRWRAELVPAASDDPLLLIRECRPFLRLGSSAPELHVQAKLAQRAFDADFPHVTAHGRVHENDFTRFVEAARARHPYGSVLAPIADVLRFLNDSVHVVENAAMPQDMSIGEYFHQRRIPTNKLVSLYRSLFIIMEVPFHVGFARSMYLERSAPGAQDIVGATHQLLAFREETTGALHVISPGTTRGSWLLDEMPMEIIGTTATFFKFRPGLLPPREIFTHILPAPRIADNGKIERQVIFIHGPGSVHRARLSGTLTGYPAAIAEHGSPGLIEARIAPWFAVPYANKRLPDFHTSPTARAERYTHDPEMTEQLPDAADLRLDDLLEIPFVDAALPNDTCPFYIPFPFVVRFDVVVNAIAYNDLSFQPIPDIALDNEAGSFRLTTERAEDRVHIIHVEFVSTATLVDREAHARLDTLIRTAREALERPLFQP